MIIIIIIITTTTTTERGRGDGLSEYWGDERSYMLRYAYVYKSLIIRAKRYAWPVLPTSLLFSSAYVYLVMSIQSVYWICQ